MHGHDADSAVAEQDPLIGKVIGAKYQILSFLGRGGMSVVYMAKQHPINRIVALKMLLAHLSKNEGSVKRFLQEATAAGQLTHPNVVSVFDFGLTEDGQPYLVMDLVKGDSLSQIVASRGPMPYKEALPLFIQICEGLTVAHEKGVIHRDLKPSNIVVEERADGRHARIVDFGIAKMLDAESQQLTKTGEIFGSPFYMSPEQCEGRPLDNRSDIYSLGIVFYEVLTGIVPLAGKSSLETMRLHMEQTPESFQKIAPASNIPLALENIVFKMINKSREKRYADTRAVAAELELLLEGEANALSGNLEYVSREISRKSKTITTWATAAGVLTLLSVVIVLAYPHVCAAYAEDQYSQAQSALRKNELARAEKCLKTSIDLGRNLHDIKLESRGLDTIVALYRREGKKDDLSVARKRKQELIKEELDRLGLTDSFIDNYVSGVEQNPSAAVALSGEPSASSDDEAPVGTDDELLAPIKKERRPRVEFPNAPMPKSAPRSTAHLMTQNTSEDKRASSDALQAMPTSSPTTVIMDRRKQSISLRASSSGGSSSGGSSSGEDSLGGASSDAQNTSTNSGLLNGATNGTIGPKPVDKPKGNFATRMGNALVSIVASPDKLERLEVMLDHCIDQNSAGSFERAIHCANAAIKMHNLLNFSPDEELAELYSKKAYAHFRRNQMKMAKKNAMDALNIVGKEGTSEAGAEAETVLALLYAKNGKQRLSIEQYQHAQARLNDPNSNTIVRGGISGLN